MYIFRNATEETLQAQLNNYEQELKEYEIKKNATGKVILSHSLFHHSFGISDRYENAVKQYLEF